MVSKTVGLKTETFHCNCQLLASQNINVDSQSVDGNGGPSHAQDSVKLGSDEGYAWLFDGLSEALAVDADAGDAHLVDGDEPLHGPGAVLDGEVAAVLGVGRRLGRVVLVVAF